MWSFSFSSAISFRFRFVDNAFDRGAKHSILLYDAFLLWWYWLCKGQSGYQPNQPHPLIGFTQRPCQDSLSWPFSSVSGRIFRLYWCILLLQKLIQQQHICRQNFVTNGSGIAVCQIVVRITSAFFLIFFGHHWASTKATWVNGDHC